VCQAPEPAQFIINFRYLKISRNIYEGKRTKKTAYFSQDKENIAASRDSQMRRGFGVEGSELGVEGSEFRVQRSLWPEKQPI